MNFREIKKEYFMSDANENTYLLLDHGGLPGLINQLSRCNAQWTSLLHSTAEQSALTAAPILVLASEEGRSLVTQRFVDWLVLNGAYTSTVIILSSPLELGCMRESLVARLDAKLSEDVDAMLRFFDPRILENLTKVLTVEQADYFFCPAARWRYVNRDGEIREIRSNFSSQERIALPLILNQAQEIALLEASEVDQILDLLRSNYPRITATLSLPMQHDLVKQKISMARQDGLNSVLKIAIYIAIPLIEGEKFTEGSNWHCFLEKLRQENFDSSELFTLDEEE
ncbi:protein of unknown function [Massilia yuzhufengensis]|uniref:DUF4123 domain-containing protein n=2 Tax=Massilia yuzhufengensis TaxID=1164594 RepID=A0A1I1I166_9BURK|nr:protein of unknown function [Massilia yuzhufengensis]